MFDYTSFLLRSRKLSFLKDKIKPFHVFVKKFSSESNQEPVPLWSIPTNIPILPILKYKKDVQICFLGTSSATPTSTRSTSSTDNDTLWIFDCGDGTVRQILSSPVSNMKPSVIFITHLHEDHVLGLPALLKFAQGTDKRKITVVGPIGLYDLLSPYLNAYDLKTTFIIEVVPPDKSSSISTKSIANHRYIGPSVVEGIYIVYQDTSFAVIGIPIKHSCFCIGYVIYEKAHALKSAPRKITILGDTCFPWNALQYAKYSDALVHECTFLSVEQFKAELTMHSTTSMVGHFAKMAAPHTLFLNHFSKRYFLNELKIESYHDPHTELLLAEVNSIIRSSPTEISPNDPKVIPVKDLQMFKINPRPLKEFVSWISVDRNFQPVRSLSPRYPFQRLVSEEEKPSEPILLWGI